MGRDCEAERWPEARIIAAHYEACYGHVPDDIAGHVAQLDGPGVAVCPVSPAAPGNLPGDPGS